MPPELQPGFPTPAEIPPTIPLTCIPQKTFQRNEYGLLCDVKYHYDEFGLIDWRKMISPEFLVVNKEYFTRGNRPIPETTDGLTDRELLILLGGLKKLAHIRGFSKCSYKIVSPSIDYVAVICEMEWVPNFETEGRIVVSSGIADTHNNNVNGMGRNFLASFAENRAFARCIRQFLRINIVTQEEICGKTESQEFVKDPAVALLENVMAENGVSFDTVKKSLIKKDGLEAAANFNSVEDIPRHLQFALIERIKKKVAELSAEKTV